MMVKRRAKSKIRKLESPCPLCGREIETVWMKDGSVRAVEAQQIRGIFTNMAHADGREMGVWVPHSPCEGGKGGQDVP
jgi:hypothetical protein